MTDLPKNLDGALGNAGIELVWGSLLLLFFYKDTLENVLHDFTEILCDPF